MLPRAINTVGNEKVRITSTMTNKSYIELAIMISKSCCPHTLTIIICFALKTFTICPIKGIKNISRNLPVHQIIRSQNHTTRHEIHCGTNHVVNVAYTNNVRIWIISSRNWIDGVGSHKNPL